MSSRFQKYNDILTGIDIHEIDGPNTACATAARFDWMPPNNGKITKTVSTCGLPVLQFTFTKEVLGHVPTVGPNTGEGIARLAITIAFGKSASYLAVHSVRAEGLALACSVHEQVSLMFDCFSAGDKVRASGKAPTGVTGTSNTVKTQPTTEDFVRAFLYALWDILVGTAADRTLDKYIPKDSLGKKSWQETVRRYLQKNLKDKAKKEFDKARERMDNLLKNQKSWTDAVVPAED